MIPNIFSLLGESIVGKHIAKGIIFSNSPKKFHPNGSRIQVKANPISGFLFPSSERIAVPDLGFYFLFFFFFSEFFSDLFSGFLFLTIFFELLF